ncbi:hypothetical protein [Halorubrum lipolyticum]|uniref:AI-2E family transporter n=1 Tax=Halorubrum lipolyticum DSM 21995 TaxID=1227482 RepID=M0NSE7_9EURY|nr:hypothetical protein [Halorubrum lipolyticum]EMA60701.1 hypothetical protein C469_08593 [Halorubrum lipolyticum DSM 21995]
MSDTTGKVRQLAPHWGVMFVVMFAVLALVESVVGQLPFLVSLLLVFVVAFGYPVVVRALGVAPPVWQQS